MKNYVRRSALLVVLVLGLLALSGCSTSNDDLDVELSIGYNGIVKISGGNPFVASIINNGDAFSGELQVYVNGGNSETTIYAKEFQIPENGEKDIVMALPVGTIQKEFEVQIVEGGTTVFKDTVKPVRYISPFQPVIGVVSDQPDNYKFLNSADYYSYRADEEMLNSYHQSSVSYTTGYYEEKETPEVFYIDDMDELMAYENLEFFNYLYFGDHSNLKIGSNFEEALLEFANQGGTIFVETGEDYKRLYSFLPESITNYNVEGVMDVYFVDMFERFDVGENIGVAYGNPIDSENVSFYRENEVDLAMYTRHGSGQIINLMLDLTSEELASKSYRSEIIDEIMSRGINGSNSLVNNYDYYGNNYYYMLRYIPVEKNPPYALMAILFTVYVLLVGPIFYIIFKRKDRRDRMWIAIPIASFSCLLLLYIFGFGTRYDRPIMNSISTVEYTDGDDYMEIDTEMAIFNNTSGNLKIDWDKDLQLRSSSDYYDYYYGEQTREVKGKITTGSRNTFERYDTGLWGKADFMASKVIPTDISGEGDFVTMNIDGDKISFEIFNKSPFDLETAFVQWGNSYVYVGDVASMEKVSIEVSDSQMYSQYYHLMDSIENKYNLYDYDIDDEQRHMRSNLELLQRYTDNSYNYQTSLVNVEEIKLTGINDAPIGYDINVNDKEPDQFDKNIFTVTSQAKFTTGTELSLPAGFIQPDVMVGTEHGELWPYYLESRGWDEPAIYVYNENYVLCTFTLADYMEVEKLKLKVYPAYYEYEYYEKNEFSEGNSLQGTQYKIFNYVTNEYDDIEDINELDDFFEVDLNKYVSDGNLMISYTMDTSEEGQYKENKAIQVPEISVVGRAK